MGGWEQQAVGVQVLLRGGASACRQLACACWPPWLRLAGPAAVQRQALCSPWPALSPPPSPSPPSAPQVKDLGQQVARLVHEVQLLQSGLPPEAAGATSPGGAAFAGGNASDVTTQRLVEFKDVEVGGGAVGRVGGLLFCGLRRQGRGGGWRPAHRFCWRLPTWWPGWGHGKGVEVP